MEGLLPFLCLDIFIIFVSLLIIRTQVTFLHPFTMYLFFHLVVISARAWQLYYGSPPMYAENHSFEDIREAEFIRAIWMADVALFLFCIFSWLGQYPIFPTSHQNREKHYYKMELNIVNKTCLICLPVGFLLFALIKLGVPLPETSYFGAFGQWLISCILILLFTKGFRPHLTAAAFIYLAIVAVQGYHRTQLILPIIFLISLDLIRRQKKWPNKYIVIFAIIGGIVFPQLKYIGWAVSDGDYDKAITLLIKPFSYSTEDKNNHTTSIFEGVKVSTIQFLDQYAGSLTMLDNKEKHYYGSTYLAMVTLPIPRLFWPGKPGLGDHTIEVSTDTRQYDVEGRIITYIGESYFNFGYIGIFIVPSLLAFCLSRWFHTVRQYNNDSLSLCVWLIVYSSLIQVFRDGLSSFITFTIMINTPIFFILFWVHISNKMRKN
jgi:oligosaccharide repeat unit polymerase